MASITTYTVALDKAADEVVVSRWCVEHGAPVLREWDRVWAEVWDAGTYFDKDNLVLITDPTAFVGS